MNLLRPARVLLLGAPGAGKGTQTSRLLKRFDLAALSSGDLLRRNIAEQTALGLKASAIIKQGGLLPDDVMVDVVSSELRALGWLGGDRSWLLDGFPRTRGQAQQLDAVLAATASQLNFVVQLKVPEEVILERIENRFVHVPSGRVYNLTYNPPKEAGKDDVTGEPLSRRPDDDPVTFRKRLAEYKALTEPLLEYYSRQAGVVFSVEGETSDIIYPQLEAEFVRRFT
ncbi:adenylate kinase-domain-containing protein [Dipodascopsis tothii]|uniref:adenylate kinase-domain-containing protein n=1 Tax=Dipodascopsis tothii TaxID=44089 RepID=UPI0034CDE62E